MDKIKIGDEEYTIDEIKSSMMKNEDYTRKTSELAREKERLQAQADNVKDLLELQQYTAQNPELRAKLEDIMKAEQAKLAGVPYKSPYADLSKEEDNGDETIGLTKDEIAELMEQKVQGAINAYKQEQEGAKFRESFNKEIEELKNRGYTPEELAAIAEYGKLKRMVSPKDAANSLIVQEKIPNKYKKKETEAPAPILAGKAASGFDIEDPEKELIKYGGDPAAMLKARADKLFIKDD